ncbi:MAG: 50S ribosomal protein L22 [Anaerolineales bacterium]
MAMETDVQATTRFVPMSPQKVRLVVDVVRGMEATEALDTLRFLNKAAAKPVSKVIRSAIASSWPW